MAVVEYLRTSAELDAETEREAPPEPPVTTQDDNECPRAEKDCIWPHCWRGYDTEQC